MMKFDFKGIKIVAATEMRRIIYKDERRGKCTRLERDVNVEVHFWSFAIIEGDLFGLAFVKSVLQYFMSCYWKRTSKAGSKIELEKILCHEDYYTGTQTLLCFSARQKDNKHYLHVCLKKDGREVNAVYLDGQEVILLDNAIGKAISWLVPNGPVNDFV